MRLLKIHRRRGMRENGAGGEAMTRVKETFTAKLRYQDDGAVNARYRVAKPKKKDTPDSGAKKKDAAPRKAKASDQENKAAVRGKAAEKKPTEKKTAEKKPAEKKLVEKKAAEKKTAAVKAAPRRAVVKEAPKKPERRETGREKRERVKMEGIFRDRRRAVSRGVDMKIVMIVLLTALFDTMGLLIAAIKTQGVIDVQALQLIVIMTPLCLLTSLLLPRILPIDPLIMSLTNFLCGVGVVILYTVSPERGTKQALYYVIGIAAMLVMSMIVSKKRRFHGLTVLSMFLGIGALILPLAFGQWSGGAKNWVQLPFIGSFQPSELVKLSLVLSMAYYFSAHRTVWQMMPAILFAGACLILLMLQRDLGTALIYYLTALVLFYAASGNMPLTIIGLGGGAGAAVLGYQMFAHVKVRVAMWRNPWSDPLDKGYQIIQALLAIGSGGLFGVGLGQGTPEKIPAYFNDFIFAVICEQLGIVFGVLVLTVYMLIILRGVSVISRSRRSFDMLLGCGVLAMLAVQTFMIVGGVIKMLPLTGVTMPFLSYGGSSLLSCLMMMGILHGISARAQEDLEDDILGITQ